MQILSIITSMCSWLSFMLFNSPDTELVNECTTKIHDCDLNAICTDTETSFTCDCNEGYLGSGKNGDCLGEK